MTDLSLSAGTAEAYSSAMTPAAIQPSRELLRRRLIFAAAAFATLAVFATAMFRALGLQDGSWPVLETPIFVFMLLGLPWTVAGFWNAAIGLWLLHGRRDGLAASAPFLKAANTGAPLTLRTAVVMTIRNEDPARAMLRLSLMRGELDATGEGAAFDYFVLSDTSDPAIADAEEACCEKWRQKFGNEGRLVYRRRTSNEGYKAGNVRDFLAKQGANYALFLSLDADSLMTGEAIVRLARIMEAYPRIGILQSLITGTPAKSAFARLFQFGMRHSMRCYTTGSAWWTGDCGPYWGHNALIRVAPFRDYCELPVLPGKPPFGGPVMSHDQIEAVMMRKAGYEVRVLPVEGGSYEDNPPTLLDFAQRDLRWCQGNLQYWHFLAFPGLKTVSRIQILFAMIMYLGSAAWTIAVALGAAGLATGLFRTADLAACAWIVIALAIMNQMPRLAGIAEVFLTRGGAERYGGWKWLLAGACAELCFYMLMMPVVTFRTTLFIMSLPLGKSALWSGQQRDVHNISWRGASEVLWLPSCVGVVLAFLSFQFPPAFWMWPLAIALCLSIPFAIVSASPRLGAWMAKMKICGIPEDFENVAALEFLSASANEPSACEPLESGMGRVAHAVS